MNGFSKVQYHFDFRTGRETGIPNQGVSEGIRAACSALNRQRTFGLQEAARQTPSRQPVSPHVWAATVARNASDWNIPLVKLSSLELSRDRDGFIISPRLEILKSGAEASPFADREWGVVYKLFPLHITGGLGKTFELERDEGQGGFEMTVRDAVLAETLEKLSVLSDAGALPTEIVGLEENGDYLIAKQPLAFPFLDLESDRLAAVKRMRAVLCKARFKRQVWIIWENERAWVLSDLHPGNVMRDANDEPCIIDALLAPLAPALIESDRLLIEAVEDARALRSGLPMPKRKSIDEACDDEL